MSESVKLPPGWELTNLQEVVAPVLSIDPRDCPDQLFTYFDIGAIDGTRGIVTNPKRIFGKDAPSRARQVVQPGDVLVSTVRPYLRAIAQVPEGTEYGVASTAFCILRGETGISNAYLYYLTRSDAFIKGLEPLQRGTSYPAVRDRDVLAQAVPLAPSAEQIRIVEKLEKLFSDLDAAVVDLQTAQAKLKQYRQSLLKAAVTGELTAEWREQYLQIKKQVGRIVTPTETGAELLARILAERRNRWEAKQLAEFKAQGKAPPKRWQCKYPESVAATTDGIVSLPDGWAWATLDQLVAESGYGTSVKCNYGSDGIPVLRIPNIVAGTIDTDDLKFATQELNLATDEYLRGGDILVVRTNGSIRLVGRTAVVDDEWSGFYYFASYLLRLRCVIGEIIPKWIGCYLTSEEGRRSIEAGVTSSSGQHNISLRTLLSLPIPLPSLEEQDVCMAMASTSGNAFDERNRLIAHGLEQAEAQRRNILQAAFVGDLVAQYLDDESAAVLLRRVGAARAKRMLQPKLRTKKQVKKLEVDTIMERLFNVLEKTVGWISAQEAFRRCGVVDGVDTDRIEEIYAELWQIDKDNRLETRRVGQLDEIRLRAGA